MPRKTQTNRKWNAIIGAAGAIALVGCFFLIRQQTAVTDVQFLKSMIPHHAGAILMCEQRPAVQDADIKRLCDSILAGQTAEIAEMKSKLAALRQ